MNAPATTPKPILTVEDLIERWGVSREMIFARVDDPENPLPILILSGKKGKNRTLARFRLVAVEAWEASVERRAIKTDEPNHIPPGMPIGYTGEIHTRRSRRNPARKST